MNTTSTEIEAAAMAVRLYAERHPRPPHVTQRQAAKMARVSEPTIRKMVRAGVLKLNKFGLIPIEDVDRAIAGEGQRGG